MKAFKGSRFKLKLIVKVQLRKISDRWHLRKFPSLILLKSYAWFFFWLLCWTKSSKASSGSIFVAKAFQFPESTTWKWRICAAERVASASLFIIFVAETFLRIRALMRSTAINKSQKLDTNEQVRRESPRIYWLQSWRRPCPKRL